MVIRNISLIFIFLINNKINELLKYYTIFDLLIRFSPNKNHKYKILIKIKI